MKLDKSQMPQVVVLGVLLLACIGYVGVQFSSRSKPEKPKTQAAAPMETKNTPGPAPVAENTQEDLINLQLAALPPVNQRDPFTPQLSMEMPGQFRINGPREHLLRNISTRIEVPRSQVPKFGALPGMGSPFKVEPLNVPVPGSGNGQSQTAAAQPEPTFAVTGIIRGERNVAILRMADERHIVREGQWINGTYKVVAITENGVILVGKDRRISLRLGGEKNASQS